MAQSLAVALTTLRGSNVFDATFGFDGLNALAEQIEPNLIREQVRIGIITLLDRDPASARSSTSTSTTGGWARAVPTTRRQPLRSSRTSRCRSSSKPSPTTGSRCISGAAQCLIPPSRPNWPTSWPWTPPRCEPPAPPASASSRTASSRSPSPGCSPRSWPPPACSSVTTST
ncbi:hypothetical protein NKG94_11035 [Micromonospora sp. M12]